MSNHTPGPWGIKRINYGAYHVGPATLERPSREAIDYAAKSGLDLLARRTANARLIAAAPDLLDMCERLLGFAWHYGSTSGVVAGGDMLAQAKALIAQVKGGAV